MLSNGGKLLALAPDPSGITAIIDKVLTIVFTVSISINKFGIDRYINGKIGNTMERRIELTIQELRIDNDVATANQDFADVEKSITTLQHFFDPKEILKNRDTIFNNPFIPRFAKMGTLIDFVLGEDKTELAEGVARLITYYAVLAYRSYVHISMLSFLRGYFGDDVLEFTLKNDKTQQKKNV